MLKHAIVVTGDGAFLNLYPEETAA